MQSQLLKYVTKYALCHKAMIMRLNTKKIKEKYRTSKSLPHDLLYWPPFFCMVPKRCFSYHRKPFCTSVSFKQSNGYIIIRDSKFCIIYFLFFSFFYQKQSMDRLYWAGTVLLLKFSAPTFGKPTFYISYTHPM